MTSLPVTENDLKYHESCPACKGDRWTPYRTIRFQSQALEYQLCGNCSLLFMNPVPTQRWYNRLYAEEFWEAKSIQKSHRQAAENEFQWKKELQRAEKFISFLNETDVAISPDSSILEIGCAYGLIVRTLADHFGASAQGVEPSHAARLFCEQFTKVEMIAENMDQLKDWKERESIDMFVFSHVMENIVDLNEVFKNVHRLLKPKGYILMDTPNLFYTVSLHIHHPYCFSKKSLHFLFKNQGFGIKRIKASGRPKKILAPKYLTLVAQKEREEAVQREERSQNTISVLPIRLGQMWYSISSRFPLKLVDSIVAGHIYSLGRQNSRRLEVLRKEVLQPGV